LSQEYFVKTDQFEGPLDLLLHLIRVHEIDIFAIDVLLLTQEYLAYLRLIQFDDLQQAGEFLEMAATLIEIKTRMLLPHDETAAGEDGEPDDPIKSLQERLLQYEMFRNAAEHFSQMPQMGVEIQSNNEWNRLMPLYEHIEAPLTGEAATLVVLYEQMLRGLSERKNAKVVSKLHRITVEETIEKMGKDIEASRFALFQGMYNRLQSRDELVVNVMAMRELVKMKRIQVYQQDLMGPIWMYRMDCDESVLPLGRVATPQFAEDGGESLPAESREVSAEGP
jgi:segregation and condensation protein A